LTPEDLELDAGVFSSREPLTVYRIAKSRYANLSGIGAALFPGRWNQPGEEAIYTSLNPATAVLEVLAHVVQKKIIPSNLSIMTIRVSGKWKPRGDSLFDPETDASLDIARSLSHVYRKRKPPRMTFGESLWSRFALAVPSVIVPAWNVVLFPRGTGFWKHVSLEKVEEFEFDPRLFSEEARKEPAQEA
jgi:RES domain-containing protein